MALALADPLDLDDEAGADAAEVDEDAEADEGATGEAIEAEEPATEMVAGPLPGPLAPVPEAVEAPVVPLPPAAAPPATTLMLPVVGLGIGWPSAPTSWPIPHCTPCVVLVGAVVEPSALAICGISELSRYGHGFGVRFAVLCCSRGPASTHRPYVATCTSFSFHLPPLILSVGSLAPPDIYHCARAHRCMFRHSMDRKGTHGKAGSPCSSRDIAAFGTGTISSAFYSHQCTRQPKR